MAGNDGQHGTIVSRQSRDRKCLSGGVLVFEFFALMVIDAGVSFSFYKNNLFHITIE